MNLRKFIILGAILSIAVVIAGTLELPLPEGIARESVITAKIESCDIEKSTGGKTTGSPNFVGFYLSEENAPYIRWNPDKDEFKTISALCKQRTNVTIWYTATRLILRPETTYWLKKYSVTKT